MTLDFTLPTQEKMREIKTRGTGGISQNDRDRYQREPIRTKSSSKYSKCISCAHCTLGADCSLDKCDFKQRQINEMDY